MPVYLALFRGINVSGHNIIKMENLKKLMHSEGYSNVETYIQSGNVVFESPETDKPKIAFALENLMYKEYGHNVVIFVVDETQMKEAVDNNPYTGREPEGQGVKKFFTAFLSDVPEEENLGKLKRSPIGDDTFKLVGKVLYLKLAQSAADSKLSSTFLEAKLKVKATSRNWNTTLKLLSMLESRRK
jgi:uncharacterized protein (DUF1697 family)